MNLSDFNKKMVELNEVCTNLENGRGNMEILSDLIISDDVDQETKVIICQKLYGNVPVLVASYNRLQGVIQSVLNPPVIVDGPVEPEPEIDVEPENEPEIESEPSVNE
jgi:hypothetical protein